MNLQPLYPSWTKAGADMAFVCSNCKSEAPTATVFADLDAKPGTFVCARCTGLYFKRYGEVRDALIERDYRELRSIRALAPA